MRLYFTGVAIGLHHRPARPELLDDGPSFAADRPPSQFYNWVYGAASIWRQIIDLPDEDPDKIDLLNLFRAAYDDLAATAENIPPFDQVGLRLRLAISQTYIREVNTRGTAELPRSTGARITRGFLSAVKRWTGDSQSKA